MMRLNLFFLPQTAR